MNSKALCDITQSAHISRHIPVSVTLMIEHEGSRILLEDDKQNWVLIITSTRAAHGPVWGLRRCVLQL